MLIVSDVFSFIKILYAAYCNEPEQYGISFFVCGGHVTAVCQSRTTLPETLPDCSTATAQFAVISYHLYVSTCIYPHPPVMDHCK